MSLGKLPGIKGLVSGSQGKRRFKSDLSVDMISPPLGDFRHTMHVGRGGDVFGDTSFLSNYGGNREPGSPDSANSSKTTGFFTRTFRHVRKNSGPRPRGGSRDLSSPPPDISPIIKNAISLPQLNVDSPNGCLQRVLFPSSISATDDSFYTYGEIMQIITSSGGITLTRSDSLTSFTVDLGPSLMTEVLSLIDNPSCLQTANHSPLNPLFLYFSQLYISNIHPKSMTIDLKTDSVEEIFSFPLRLLSGGIRSEFGFGRWIPSLFSRSGLKPSFFDKS
uniref:CDC42 effector protein (Rho GTPase binding) 1b n=1 Tax=Acanthochromis polyacanthus TaxID=80966 RepID=A0A3Q1F1T9_9TELE